jgi:hypothetical protein
MVNSRLIWGWIISSAGFLLLLVPAAVGWGGFFAWIYGLPLFIIGVVILLNNREDVIEERKDIEDVKERKSERRSRKNG